MKHTKRTTEAKRLPTLVDETLLARQSRDLAHADFLDKMGNHIGAEKIRAEWHEIMALSHDISAQAFKQEAHHA